MSIFRRNSSDTSFTGPVEIAVQVEVEVHDDEESHEDENPRMGNGSHGDGATAASSSTPRTITARPLAQQQRHSQSSFDSFHSPTPTHFWADRIRDEFLGRNSEMSLPRADYDPRRVCLAPFPNFHLGRHRRTIGVYVAGALFAIASWIFLDAAILSKHAHVPWGDEPPVHVSFVDWIPGICSLLGYLIVNLIDKDRIKGEEGFGDSRAVWRARLFLFIGFAFMAGGLAGSVTVLVLKYLLGDYPEMFKYYGYANVSQNILLMLSAIVLWMAQSTSSEYEYNLTL